MVSQLMREKVLKAHARGYTPSEISKWIGLTVEEIDAIIVNGDGRPKPQTYPEFIEPKLF